MKLHMNESNAKAVGMYDPRFEHDNCGIGAVVNIKGVKTHQTVENALKIVENLKHRAGKDAEGKTGDGVGILLQISHRFFSKTMKSLGVFLGEERDYGIGMFFFPQDELKRNQAKKMFEVIIEKEGLELLSLARRETNLPVVSEIMSPDDLPLFENVDLLQVGARNMQNYDLLRALGRVKKPVLLKRGSGATLRELLLSAEYILSGGNENVILCERGIRTFSDGTRSTLDLSAVPLLHEMTHLPVVVDPSHAVGRASLVPPMALAAAACGADGLLIEVHNDPLHALCDGAQALLPEDFAALARQIAALREVTRR